MTKRGWLLLLSAAAVLAGAAFLPGGVLAARERMLYGKKQLWQSLGVSFSMNTGTLLQRLEVIGNHGSVSEIDVEVGESRYYDPETLVFLCEKELDELAETNRIGKAFQLRLEDLLAEEETGHVLSAGYLCVVDSSTGNTFLLGYLASLYGDLELYLDLDSEKLIYMSGSVGEMEQYLGAVPWHHEVCADTFARYLDLQYVELGGTTSFGGMYALVDPEDPEGLSAPFWVEAQNGWASMGVMPY